MDNAAIIRRMQARVARELQARGKTMRWLSRAARIGPGVTRDLLVGRTRSGRLDTWLRVADALGLTIGDLAKEEES